MWPNRMLLSLNSEFQSLLCLEKASDKMGILLVGLVALVGLVGIFEQGIPILSSKMNTISLHILPKLKFFTDCKV